MAAYVRAKLLGIVVDVLVLKPARIGEVVLKDVWSCHGSWVDGRNGRTAALKLNRGLHRGAVAGVLGITQETTAFFTVARTRKGS